MATHAADWHLLFGLLALQNGLISHKQLVAAFAKWTSDKSAALDQILVDDGALDQATCETLRRMVELHVQRNGGEPQRSLMALSGSDLGAARRALDEVGDSDLRQSIAQLPEADPDVTLQMSVGQVTSGGQRFRILRDLEGARGGMGVISVAEDQELGRQVALKQIIGNMADRPEYRQKFQVEAEITGNLEHPAIVPIYGLGAGLDGRPYYAMRLVHGDNLTWSIREFHERRAAGQVDYNSVEFHGLVDRLIDVSQAISYAHSRGVLHRDLKPGNILVGKFGETLVIDWGLARLPKDSDDWQPSTQLEESELDRPGPLEIRSGTDVAGTVQGSVLGTIGYAPPEQLSGRMDLVRECSDVYALGAILYQMLTGRPPIGDAEHGGDLGIMVKQTIEGRIKPAREVDRSIPKSLAAVCMRALSREPSDRYQTAEELIAELECWQADQPVKAAPDSLPDRILRLARRHRAATLAGALALLGVAIVTSAAVVWIRAAQQRANDSDRFAGVMQQFVVEDLTKALDAPGSSGSVSLGGAFWEASLKFQKAVANDPSALVRLHLAFGNALVNRGELDPAERHYDAARALLPQAQVAPETVWQVQAGAAIVRWRRGDPEAIEILNDLQPEMEQAPEATRRSFDEQMASAYKNTLGSLAPAERLEAIERASALYARHLPAENEPPDSFSGNFVQMMVHRALVWRQLSGLVLDPDLRARLPVDSDPAEVSLQYARDARDEFEQLLKRAESVASPDEELIPEMRAEYAKLLHRLGMWERDSDAKSEYFLQADDAYREACKQLCEQFGAQHWRTIETSYSWMILLNQELPAVAPANLTERINHGKKYYVTKFLRRLDNPSTILDQNAVGAISQLPAETNDVIDPMQLQQWLELDQTMRKSLPQLVNEPPGS